VSLEKREGRVHDSSLGAGLFEEDGLDTQMILILQFSLLRLVGEREGPVQTAAEPRYVSMLIRRKLAV